MPANLVLQNEAGARTDPPGCPDAPCIGLQQKRVPGHTAEGSVVPFMFHCSKKAGAYENQQIEFH